MFKRRKQPGPESESPFDVFLGLRNLALGAFGAGMDSGDDGSGVAAVVVDVPMDGGFVCVVALADGTTSLYTSTGGGTIGAGSHTHVASASSTLRAVVGSHLAQFRSGEDPALPPDHLVRFHVFGTAGAFVGDVPVDAFWGRAEHPSMPVIAATQDVITAISSV